MAQANDDYQLDNDIDDDQQQYKFDPANSALSLNADIEQAEQPQSQSKRAYSSLGGSKSAKTNELQDSLLEEDQPN